MSDAQSTDDDPAGDGRTAWPLVAAVVVILLVVAGILLSNRHSSIDGGTDAERIALAASAFAAAHADDDRNRWQTTVCPNFDEHRSPLPDEPREVQVTRVEAVAVDGDRATAKVTTDAGGNSTTGVWNLTRTDGLWQVCNRDG